MGLWTHTGAWRGGESRGGGKEGGGGRAGRRRGRRGRGGRAKRRRTTRAAAAATRWPSAPAEQIAPSVRPWMDADRPSIPSLVRPPTRRAAGWLATAARRTKEAKGRFPSIAVSFPDLGPLTPIFARGVRALCSAQETPSGERIVTIIHRRERERERASEREGKYSERATGLPSEDERSQRRLRASKRAPSEEGVRIGDARASVSLTPVVDARSREEEKGGRGRGRVTWTFLPPPRLDLPLPPFSSPTPPPPSPLGRAFRASPSAPPAARRCTGRWRP